MTAAIIIMFAAIVILLIGLGWVHVKFRHMLDVVSNLALEVSNTREMSTRAINIMTEEIEKIDDKIAAATKPTPEEEELTKERLKGEKLYNEGLTNLLNYTGFAVPKGDKE